MENTLAEAQAKCDALVKEIKTKEDKLESLGQLRKEISQKREEMTSVISKLNLEPKVANKKGHNNTA